MNGLRLFGPGSTRADEASLGTSGFLPRTALPVVQRVPQDLKAHLERLEAGAAALGQPVDWMTPLQAELEAWLRSAIPEGDVALRLVLHPLAQVVVAQLEPLPKSPKPYRLAVLPHPIGARQTDPQVTHKGLAGPWGMAVLAQARQLGAEDALLVWPDGSVAETAIAAVALEIDELLIVPPPPGRVRSLAERLSLPDWAVNRGLQIHRHEVTLAQARTGQIWCMNALRGIWPATLL